MVHWVNFPISFFGIKFTSVGLANFVRIALYLALLLIFELYFYLNRITEVAIISLAVVLAVIFFLSKIAGHVINSLLSSVTTITNTNEPNQSDIPEGFSEEVWSVRDLLKNPSPNLDVVVNDLIQNGYDCDEIFNLVDYLKDNQVSPVVIETVTEDMVYFCGKLHPIGNLFERSFIENFIPLNNTVGYTVFTLIVTFACVYLSLYVRDQFLDREKWWVAFVVSSSVYTIFYPPSHDPFLMNINDCWGGGARALAISIICGLWIAFLKLQENYGISTLPFYDMTINWNTITPIVSIVFKWAMILFQFWVLAPMVGHPISVIVSFIESVCRYAFGQNGVGSIIHMIIQLVRGCISVACVWGVLQDSLDDLHIAASIAIATFLSLIPIPDKGLKKIWQKVVFGPFISAAISLLISYIITHFAKPKYSVVKWVCFGILAASDIVFPFLDSCQRYFIFHCIFFRYIKIFGFIRGLITQFIVPIFISCTLVNTKLDPIYISFLIVHAVYKSYTEPHIIVIAIFLSIVTFYYDFDLTDHSTNFFLSLIIATKLESFYHSVENVYKSRYIVMLFSEVIVDYTQNILTALFLVIGKLIDIFPLIDFCWKVPTLIWAFITGGNTGKYLGIGYFLTPHPIRPYYFYDHPKTTEPNINELFTTKIIDHPIETPVYFSMSHGLTESFAKYVRNGRLGYVNVGDMFIFISNNFISIVHVISIEPNCIKIQMRGLEYSAQTACHESEINFLKRIIDDYEVLPNFHAAFVDSVFQFDLRLLSFNISMYETTKTDLSTSFSGIDQEQMRMGFLNCLCYILTKVHIDINEIQEIPQSLDHETRAYFAYDNKMRQFLEQSQFEFDDNSLHKYLILFYIIGKLVYNQDGSLNKISLTNVFKGDVVLHEQFSWVFNSDKILNNVILRAIYLGVGVNYMNSNGLGYSSTDPHDEIVAFLNEFLQSYVVVPINSEEFQKAFLEKERTILTVAKQQNNEPILLRFNVSDKLEWSVYKINSEHVRSLWAYEEHDLMYHMNSESERTSIQSNQGALNNLVIQSCDLPVGYPAYVSPILNSYSTCFDLF
ncbi:pecanex-like protein 1 isoform X1 [Histomonas meleagridis]|nr:pecanex-like protein 1 isoform X1 [Histomonas meleagridis]